LEQFSAFLKILPELEATLKSEGQELPRPHYATEDASEAPASVKDEATAEPEDMKAIADDKPSSSKLDKFKFDKKNHDATSDEED
jgi:hypothetical protein